MLHQNDAGTVFYSSRSKSHHGSEGIDLRKDDTVSESERTGVGSTGQDPHQELDAPAVGVMENFIEKGKALHMKVDTMAQMLLDIGDKDFLGYRKGDLRKAMLLRKNKSKRLQEVQKETLQKLSAWLIACVVGGLVIASGVAVHLVVYFSVEANEEEQSSVPLGVVLRVLYVIGAMPFLYLASWWMCRLVLAVAKVAETDVMNLNKGLQRDATNCLFLFLEWIWTKLVFNLLFCNLSHVNLDFYQACEDQTYQQVAMIFSNIAACLFVFAMANLITSFAGRFLSLVFVHWKHFEKLQDALEADHYIRVLSRPISAMTEFSPLKSEGTTSKHSIFSVRSTASAYFTQDTADDLGVNLYRDYNNIRRPLDALISSITDKDFEYADKSELTQVNAFLINRMAHKIFHAVHGHASTDAQKEEFEDRILLFAHLLYRNIAYDTSVEQGFKSQITFQDIRRFYTPDRKGEKLARRTQNLLDDNRDGRISIEEFVASIQGLFAKRVAMAQALGISRDMIITLEYGLTACIHSIFVALYIKIWGVDSAGTVTFLVGILALLAFSVFTTVKELTSCLLFVAIVHPYDIGDTVILCDHFAVVRSINLTVTELVKSSGEVLYIPNANLREENIVNLSRGTFEFNALRIEVDVGVSQELRQELLTRMLQHMDDHPDDFIRKSTKVHLTGISRENLKIEMGIDFAYAFPPDCWSRKKPARDAIFSIISDVLNKYKQEGGIKATCEEIVEERTQKQ